MRQRHLRTETLRKGVIILVKKSREFGYARVSTKHQNTDRQLQALQCYDISVKGIFIDKQSGKDFERQNMSRRLFIPLGEFEMGCGIRHVGDFPGCKTGNRMPL